MFKKIVSSFVGDPNKKIIGNLRPLVLAVAQLEPELKQLPDEALKESVVAARGLIGFTEHAVEGRIPHLVSPFARAGLTTKERKAAPGLGEDSDAVLRGLGYSESDIAELRKSGVVTSEARA